LPSEIEEKTSMESAGSSQEVVEVVQGVVDKLYDPWVALCDAQRALGALGALEPHLGTTGKTADKFHDEVKALQDRVKTSGKSLHDVREGLEQALGAQLEAPPDSKPPVSSIFPDYAELGERIHIEGDPAALAEAIKIILPFISHTLILGAHETIEECGDALRGVPQPAARRAINLLGGIMPRVYSDPDNIHATLPNVVNHLIRVATGPDLTARLALADPVVDLAAHDARFRRFKWPLDLWHGPLPQASPPTATPPPKEQRSGPGAGSKGSGTDKRTSRRRR
jgi:hypothetical protein